MKSILKKMTYLITVTLIMISCNEEIFGPKAAYWGNNNQVVLYNKNYKSDTNTVANLNSIFSNYVKNKCPNNVCPLYDSFPKDSNIILTTFYNDSILTYPHILDFYTGREEFYVGSYLGSPELLDKDNSILSNINFYTSTSNPVLYPKGKTFLDINFRLNTNQKRFDPTTINSLDIVDQEKNFLKQYASINPPKQFRVYIKTNYQQKQYSDTLDILYEFNDETVNPYPLISRKSQFWGAILTYRFNNQRFLTPPYGQIPEEN